MLLYEKNKDSCLLLLGRLSRELHRGGGDGGSTAAPGVPIAFLTWNCFEKLFKAMGSGMTFIPLSNDQVSFSVFYFRVFNWYIFFWGKHTCVDERSSQTQEMSIPSWGLSALRSALCGGSPVSKHPSVAPNRNSKHGFIAGIVEYLSLCLCQQWICFHFL